MLGAKDMLTLWLIPLLTVALFTSGEENFDDFYERALTYNQIFPLDYKLKDLIETKRSMTGMKNFIENLQNKLEKRMACALDGGFSASCNHKDAVEAGDHHRFLASSFAPGRRKRRSLRKISHSFGFKF